MLTDLNIIYQLFDHLGSIPDSIEKISNKESIYYYFNKSNVINITLDKKKYILNAIHTIIYDKNVHWVALCHNHSVTPEIQLTETQGIYTIETVEFTKENFSQHKSEILHILLKGNALLSFLNDNNKFTLVFRINFNNIMMTLTIDDNFQINKLPVIDGTFGTQSYYSYKKPFHFIRQINSNTKEYILYYSVPHEQHHCHKYLNNLKKWFKTREQNKTPTSAEDWLFNVSEMTYFFLIYQVNSDNMITKMNYYLTDCPPHEDIK